MSDLAVEVKPKSKISRAEMQRRREALRQADAHNRIEGQFPGVSSGAIFAAFVRGDIERDEILPRQGVGRVRRRRALSRAHFAIDILGFRRWNRDAARQNL